MNEVLAEWISLLSQVLSTAVVLLIAVGLRYRHRPAIHMPLMKLCFAVDVLNVVLIEVSGALLRGKSAVRKSVEATTGGEGSGLLVFHVVVSVATLVGYAVALTTGRRLYRTGRGRRLHRTNAYIFVVLRLANYVTSFMVTT